MQSLPSQVQKQIDILKHSGSTLRNRVKACTLILEEGNKIKPEFKERFIDTIKKESITLYNTCIAALNSFELSPVTTGNTKFKQDTKAILEIEEAINAIPKILNILPADKFKELSVEDLYKVIINVFQPEIQLKYKSIGFTLLIKYVQLAKNAAQSIDSVIFILIVALSLLISLLAVIC